MYYIACIILGTIHLSKSSPKKALFYFLKAHSLGSIFATSLVGFCYEFGLGVEKDAFIAEVLYAKAMKGANKFAVTRLAFLKMHGRKGVRIHMGQAKSYRKQLEVAIGDETMLGTIGWLEWASELAIKEAQFCLSLCYFHGYATVINQTKSFEWCRKSATQGFPPAQNLLGNMYIEGFGAEVNFDIGMMLYIRAAEKRESTSIYNIGTLFERGMGVPKSIDTAVSWYKRAAKFDSVNAHNVLGIFHEQSIILNSCPEEGIGHYEIAAMAGHPHALYNLARCYHDGFGVDTDNQKAIKLFQEAAEQYHLLSQISLAVCYEYGIGCKIDMDEAEKWYVKAAENGGKHAKLRLIPIVMSRIANAAKAFLIPTNRSNYLNILPVEISHKIIENLNVMNVLSRSELYDVFDSIGDTKFDIVQMVNELETSLQKQIKKSCSCLTPKCERIIHVILGLKTLEPLS